MLDYRQLPNWVKSLLFTAPLFLVNLGLTTSLRWLLLAPGFKGPSHARFHLISQSHPSQWKVLEQLNEHVSQKYRCRETNDRNKIAHIRIYKQIPHFGTETDSQAIRARQATPPELTAYREMADKDSNVTPRLLGWRREQQDRSGLIHSGFLVSLAWEEVAGIQPVWLGGVLAAQPRPTSKSPRSSPGDTLVVDTTPPKPIPLLRLVNSLTSLKY